MGLEDLVGRGDLVAPEDHSALAQAGDHFLGAPPDGARGLEGHSGDLASVVSSPRG